MMDFSTKDLVHKKISENKTVYDKLQNMTGIAIKLATIVDSINGSSIADEIMAEATGAMQTGINSAGIATSQGMAMGTQADKARSQAAEVTNPS